MMTKTVATALTALALASLAFTSAFALNPQPEPPSRIVKTFNISRIPPGPCHSSCAVQVRGTQGRAFRAR